MATMTTTMVCQQTCRNTGRPSWLQATLTDLEQRFHALSVDGPNSSLTVEISDSFAGRAENYYRKRPQLLALIQDLYNKYLYLSDRYVQSLLKPQQLSPPSHWRSNSQTSSLIHSDISDPDQESSDAESSLSFQPPNPKIQIGIVADEVVVELVIRFVENDILRDELVTLEKYLSESTRKMDLQRSLVEVLESERMVLLTENARLGFKATAISEENESLAAEVGFMRRKAGELARCMVKLREDHKVCMLGRKIETLQAQIYGLEKRNRECYEVMAGREEEKAEIVRGVCVELERLKAENKRLREAAAAMAERKKAGGMWRKLEGWFLCGSHVGNHV